jgi:hypothetical protein
VCFALALVHVRASQTFIKQNEISCLPSIHREKKKFGFVSKLQSPEMPMRHLKMYIIVLGSNDLVYVLGLYIVTRVRWERAPRERAWTTLLFSPKSTEN